MCLFRHCLQREKSGVVEGGWFKQKQVCKAMFLFWFLFSCLLVKCKKAHLTKTSCINLSINVCPWESPVSSFFPSMACCLSSAHQCVCVCVSCIHACASTCVSVTPSFTRCVGIRGAGEAGVCRRAACVSMITCNYCSLPRHPPSSPLKRPWCSQHLP